MKSITKVLALSAIMAITTGVNAQHRVKHQKVYKKTVAHRQSLKSLITGNVGKYAMMDLNLFRNPVFMARFKRTTGADYKELVKNFNTETPIVTDGELYKFSACKAHDCAAYRTDVYYDPKTDRLMITNTVGDAPHSYSEKGKLYPSDTLKGM